MQPAKAERRLGRYEVLEEIGHGGMASVFRARDVVLEREVALKVLHPHLRGAAEARARFRREAKTVARLRHPHVLDVYDFGEDDDAEAYLATELLTGPTLKVFVADHARLLAEHCVALAAVLADALATAHEAGIVHRDVKPENVILHDRRTLKLTDFGIAHLVDSHTVTSTGQVIGSPGHMAPEIVQGGDATVASDVFAFGTLLYYLVTGVLPFTGKNPHQLLFRVLEGDFVDPLRIEPAIGRPLAELVSSCLAKEPAERPASMRKVEAELRAFLVERGFDDVGALVREVLADPAAATARVRPLAVKAEIALGDRAQAAGNVVEALGHFDRALALDPGRADVLDRVRSIGAGGVRQARMRRLGFALGALGVLALVGAVVGYSVAPARFEPDTVRPDSAIRRTVPPATSSARGPTAMTAPTGDVAPEPSTTTAPRTSGGGGAAGATSREGATRTVVFRPEPQNVSISIDDGPPREFGPEFRSATLSVGSHRVRMVPGTECCEVTAFVLEVRSGTGPLVVQRTLPYRAARLYVVSDVPADVRVEVGGQTVTRGRARELLRVSMGSLELDARISVTAEGRQGYTGPVRLRAGEVMRTTVALPEVSP